MTSPEIIEVTNGPGPDHHAAHRVLATIALTELSVTDLIAVAQVHACLEIAAAIRSLEP